MGYSTMPARRLGSRRRIRGLWLAALTILGVVALPAAAAQADATWAGASTSPEWSSATNWTMASTTPPTTNGTAAGILTFPDLPGCVAPSTCYTSHNALTGVSASQLVFSNTANQYRILGNGLTLGSGGIADNTGGPSGPTGPQGPGDVINTPLALSATQTWTIGGGFNGSYNSLSLANTATVTGSTSTLNVTFPTGPGTSLGGDLFVGGDMELGAVNVTGSGGLHIGASGSAGSVNGTNGNPVGLANKATLIANPGATVGALTSTGGKLLLGTGSGNSATTTLGVNGAVLLDSATTMTTLINDNGSTAGTDFSQLSASGNITLAGTLSINQEKSNGACATLSRGDVATLITTTGTLSGAFTNAPEGQILTLGGGCPGAQVQIHYDYTSNSVIATVVSGTTPTTTTLATPNPSTATTNQKVTLTATVATNTNSTVAPAGTVAFSANGSAISGCTSRPITVSGSSATATCSATFAAGSSPESLKAAFAPAGGSNQGSSSSSAQTLTVNKSTTSTRLAASNTNPSAGDSVTYTATVTPGVDGATMPAGTVRFMDGGAAISGCDARSLTVGTSSSTATCTVSYASGGTHTITADYAGDANFTGSSAPATTVTVKAAPTSTGKLLGPGGRLTVIGGKIRFTQKCQSKVLCRGSFSFTASVRGKNKKLTTVRCATGSFRIRAGRSATIRVTLSGACLRLLRAQRHHRLSVIYTSRSSTGQVGQRKRITLVLR